MHGGEDGIPQRGINVVPVSFRALLAYSELRTPYIKKTQNRHKRIRSSEALIFELGSGPRELHCSLSIMYSTRKSKGPCGPSRHRVCRARFDVGSVSDSSMILRGSTRTRHSHYLMSDTYLYSHGVDFVPCSVPRYARIMHTGTRSSALNPDYPDD
jgi:hypothetical protein